MVDQLYTEYNCIPYMLIMPCRMGLRGAHFCLGYPYRQRRIASTALSSLGQGLESGSNADTGRPRGRDGPSAESLGLCDACPDAQACAFVMTPRGQASHKPRGRKPRHAPLSFGGG